jgi:hypothetical protein
LVMYGASVDIFGVCFSDTGVWAIEAELGMVYYH